MEFAQEIISTSEHSSWFIQRNSEQTFWFIPSKTSFLGSGDIFEKNRPSNNSFQYRAEKLNLTG